AARNEEGFRAQFLRDDGYWAQRLSILEGTSFLGHHGLVVGDVNGDLLDDLYVCDGGGLPNRLYLQNEDGTLRDVSRESGVDWLEFTASALLVDLDNDGDQDLVLATVAMILFMENDGAGRFKLKGGHPGVAQARSMCAGDYDRDGDLDLFVTSYANPNKATGFGARGVTSSIPVPYHDANNGSRNALLKNNGSFRFVDATSESGLDQSNTRFSFAASWEDFDLDGDLDLYVANDFGRNYLYRNEGGRFVEVAGNLGVEDMASGMSVSWGDCNGDGFPDLYVGNMFSAAGQRVAYQRRFGAQRDSAELSGLRRMARGNSLFLGNREGGAFRDVSEGAGVTMGRWAWSSHFTDLNNDGRLDLVVGNGFLTNRAADDL
ncbi:MAG: VCBS repeat-containing protein, partial [Akkermansiaceae bacterium]|nr:VCBS repeat-containing protein [Akkermansiaceae bacterium]